VVHAYITLAFRSETQHEGRQDEDILALDISIFENCPHGCVIPETCVRARLRRVTLHM
jgi:hypothetical protein